jgi:hypothetical protein
MKGGAIALGASIAAALAISSADAGPTAAPTPCPTRIAAAGHLWALSVRNRFPCARAGSIVRTLAPKTAPPPAGRYPGSYAGLACVGRLPGQKPSLIVCGTRSRGFTAVRAQAPAAAW